MASGPSLTAEDVLAVKEWRQSGGLVVVANTTYRAAPWADAVFAMDPKWWSVHYAEVCETFKGRRLTTARLTGMDVEKLNIPHYRNSGAGCVSFAVNEGAKSVVLVGYDCTNFNGQTHWHGSHPAPLSDAKTIRVWPLIFDRLAKDMSKRGVRIVNASRRTALKCFEKVDLHEAMKEIAVA